MAPPQQRGDDMTVKWWQGIIYQIYPRSFYDSNGDGIGDLRGITQKLDYIQSLGVDGVWISPFFTSPMKDFGYDVADYQNIDPIFGTLDDFDEMLTQMHGRGLKLIIDLVLNHSSNKHPWFEQSRRREDGKDDWYVWADPKPDGSAPNNWLSVFGGPAWTYDTKRGQYYLHQFLKEQPDLNVRNPVVQDALLDIMKWWLDRGVDGFRLDVLNHCVQDAQLRDNPPRTDFDRGAGKDRFTHPYFWQRHLYDRSQPECLEFAERLRKLTDKYDDRMMVGEIFDDYPVQASIDYTAPGRLHTAYNFSLLQPGIYNPKALRDFVTEYLSAKDSWPAWALSNHDTERVASRWAFNGKSSAEQSKQQIALMGSLRGTVFLYEGEELGLTEADVPFEKLKDPYGIFLWPEDKGRDGCRTPMPWDASARNAGFTFAAEPWLPIPDEHTAAAVSTQESDRNSILNFTRTFIGWRKTQADLQTGDMQFMDLPEPFVGYTRGKILCLFNLSDKPATTDLPHSATALQGHGLAFTQEGKTITLPAFGGYFGKIS